MNDHNFYILLPCTLAPAIIPVCLDEGSLDKHMREISLSLHVRLYSAFHKDSFTSAEMIRLMIQTIENLS